MLRALLAALLLVVLSVSGALYLDGLERRIEHSEIELEEFVRMNQSSYVKVQFQGRWRIFPRARGETASEWGKRVASALRGNEETDLGEYICTTLTGCTGPTTIEVCTYCPQSPASVQCHEEHDADVAAFCRIFECDC